MSDDVIRTISKKLRHYLEVQRREEGFVLPAKKRTPSTLPEKDKDLSGSKKSGLHQRSISHLQRSRQIHRILSHLEETNRLSEREREVRSSLIQYVMGGHTRISSTSKTPSIQPDVTQWCDTIRNRKNRKLIGSVTRAEAERLITTATRLYVTTEMLIDSQLDSSVWQIFRQKEKEVDGINCLCEQAAIENRLSESSVLSADNFRGEENVEKEKKHELNIRGPTNKKVNKVRPTRKEEFEPKEEIRTKENEIERIKEVKTPDKKVIEEIEEAKIIKDIKVEIECLPTKFLVDNWCQTDDYQNFSANSELTERKEESSISFSQNSPNLETTTERKETSDELGEASDLESGVHLISYNSVYNRNCSEEEAIAFRAPEYNCSRRSISTDTSEDSNYCDDSYSSCLTSSTTDLSQIHNTSRQECGKLSENFIQISISQSEREETSETCSSTCSCTSEDGGNYVEIIDDNPSTCTESETCSCCCSCKDCQSSSNSHSRNQSSYEWEEVSECSTCSYTSTTPEDECEKNDEETNSDTEPKEENVDRESNVEKSNESIENSRNVENTEENTTKIEDNVPSESFTEGVNKQNEVAAETDKQKHTSLHAVVNQLTIESCDSFVLDEETRNLSIHDAARNGDLDIVKLLSKANRKFIETVDERGWTPTHLAAANNHVEIVKFLAREGAHVSALDPSGYTALHTAAMQGHKDCIEVLLEAEANVDCVTSDGFTPLHLSALNNHVECCKVLLAWGASLTKEDALGRTVLDMTEEYSLKDVKKFLEDFSKQLENFNNIVGVMDSFSDKRSDPSDEKSVDRNILNFLTSMAANDYDSSAS
ncbi:uncharacterized protein [Centruroides vittatus]|uniref:uncharacterized protein n=1 Tax=Centruroides vittatus TaxID=120091 RepID=UPI003510C851